VRTALALSPHLDDAVFSCGGTLALLARNGWRVVVATLFTRSVPDPQGFALACQLDKGLGPEVDYMALRRAEDAAAMQALGVEPPVHVPLPEAPHRGYDTAKALFATPLSGDAIGDDLAAAVSDLLARLAPEVVFAPQAVGGHVDHVQLVRYLRGRPLPPVLWWRDFPYAARPQAPAEPFAEDFAAMPNREVMLDTALSQAKHEACRAYASQLGFQFGGPDGLAALLAEAGVAERFRGVGGPELGTVAASPNTVS
jgi:LmbE family N-acetylglucosaminyl deacetylase